MFIALSYKPPSAVRRSGKTLADCCLPEFRSSERLMVTLQVEIYKHFTPTESGTW